MPSISANACSSASDTSLTKCAQSRPTDRGPWPGQVGGSTSSTGTSLPDMTPPAADVIVELTAALPPGRVLTDPDVLRGYERDEADLCDSGTPAAVLRPHTTDEVATALKIASARSTPVVPQGARTGLA